MAAAAEAAERQVQALVHEVYIGFWELLDRHAEQDNLLRLPQLHQALRFSLDLRNVKNLMTMTPTSSLTRTCASGARKVVLSRP